MITLSTLSNPYQALFILLKASIWDKDPEEKSFPNLSDSEWTEVYQLSVKQGVMAVVFDAMVRLPETLQPPRLLKINWGLSVESIEHRYERQVAVANELSELFWKNGIQMMVFKGLSLARHYPIPQHREFGDIDIYLFGKQKEGDQIMLQQGAIEEFNVAEKHSAFFYKKVPIENHKYFLGPRYYSKMRFLNQCLLERLEENKVSTEGSEKGIVFPPTDFQTPYIMCHLIRHFTHSVSLRLLCDWALFLKAHLGRIDFDYYQKTLTKGGQIKTADAFTALAIDWLELPKDCAPLTKRNPKLEEKIAQDILYPLTLSSKDRSAQKVFIYKCKLIKARYWKYRLIYSDWWGRYIWDTILQYICRPQNIFKAK